LAQALLQFGLLKRKELKPQQRYLEIQSRQYTK